MVYNAGTPTQFSLLIARQRPAAKVAAPVVTPTVFDKTPLQHYEDYVRRMKSSLLMPDSYAEWLWHNRNAPDVARFDSGFLYNQPQPATISAFKVEDSVRLKFNGRTGKITGELTIQGNYPVSYNKGDWDYISADDLEVFTPRIGTKATLRLAKRFIQEQGGKVTTEPPTDAEFAAINALNQSSADPRIGSSFQLPYFGLVTIAARVTRFGKDWYRLEHMIGESKMVLHKAVGAI